MRSVSPEENCWLCVAGLLLAVVMAPQLPAATLVQNGQARAVVVVPDTPDDHEQRAAKDLADYVAKMSGADVSGGQPGGGTARWIPGRRQSERPRGGGARPAGPAAGTGAARCAGPGGAARLHCG